MPKYEYITHQQMNDYYSEVIRQVAKDGARPEVIIAPMRGGADFGIKLSNYFDVPYKHYDSGLISTSSYTPFLLLAVIIPVSLFTIKRLKSVKTKSWIKATLVSNNLIYLILILSFGYWGLI